MYTKENLNFYSCTKCMNSSTSNDPCLFTKTYKAFYSISHILKCFKKPWELLPPMGEEEGGGGAHLGDAQLAGSQLLLVLVHLLVALRLGALQLLAALHHGLHLRLHLADVEARHRELLVDHAAALVLLEGEGRCGHWKWIAPLIHSYSTKKGSQYFIMHSTF